MTQAAISAPPPTAARRGRKTGETYEMVQELPFDEWTTVTFTDWQAATATSSTFRTIARREGVRLSVLTDRENDKLLHVYKTSDVAVNVCGDADTRELDDE